MGTFPIIVMAALGGWAILMTVLALVSGRHLRRERQEHAEALERIARYRAAVQRLERAWSGEVYAFAPDSVAKPARPFQGHREVRVEGEVQFVRQDG